MRSLLVSAALLCLCTDGLADDWPQWMGPNRDGVWRETGILTKFPARGPKPRWRVPVGLGYSGPAVSQGKVFVTDYLKRAGQATNSPGARDRLQGKERILCLDSKSGKQLWVHQYDRPYQLSYPGGPRCTPTVDGDRVYVLGAEGDLICLRTDNGTVLWSKQLTKEYRVETPQWGFSGHPLVDGETLFCLVGGNGSVAVAFDKMTGEEIWKSLSASEPGYCPPTMIDHGGTRQLLIWHPESLNSLNPKTGKLYWSTRLRPSYAMSITAPRKLKDLLFTSGMGNAAVMLKLDSQKPAVTELWRGKPRVGVACSNSTPFLDEDAIYGVDCGSGALVASRVGDGKRLWETSKATTGLRRAAHGTAFLVKNGERFFIFTETGDLLIAKLSPERYEEISRAHILDPTNNAFGRPVVWTHPAFAEKAMFARNDKQLVCVDLAR